MVKCKDGTLNWNRTSSCQNAGLCTEYAALRDTAWDVNFQYQIFMDKTGY